MNILDAYTSFQKMQNYIWTSPIIAEGSSTWQKVTSEHWEGVLHEQNLNLIEFSISPL